MFGSAIRQDTEAIRTFGIIDKTTKQFRFDRMVLHRLDMNMHNLADKKLTACILLLLLELFFDGMFWDLLFGRTKICAQIGSGLSSMLALYAAN